MTRAETIKAKQVLVKANLEKGLIEKSQLRYHRTSEANTSNEWEHDHDDDAGSWYRKKVTFAVTPPEVLIPAPERKVYKELDLVGLDLREGTFDEAKAGDLLVKCGKGTRPRDGWACVFKGTRTREFLTGAVLNTSPPSRCFCLTEVAPGVVIEVDMAPVKPTHQKPRLYLWWDGKRITKVTKVSSEAMKWYDVTGVDKRTPHEVFVGRMRVQEIDTRDLFAEIIRRVEAGDVVATKAVLDLALMAKASDVTYVKCEDCKALTSGHAVFDDHGRERHVCATCMDRDYDHVGNPRSEPKGTGDKAKASGINTSDAAARGASLEL